MVSELFYKLEYEKEPSGSYIKISEELSYLSVELNVFDILAAYNAVVSHIEGSKNMIKDFA